MSYKNILLNLKHEIIMLTTLLITFIYPIKGLFFIVGLAVFLDTFYGIYASIKLKDLKSITSHKLFNSAVKTFFYMGTILMAYLASIHISGGQLFGIKLFIPKFICGFWMFIEIKSIDETHIKLGNPSFLDTLKNIIKWLKTFKKDINDLK